MRVLNIKTIFAALAVCVVMLSSAVVQAQATTCVRPKACGSNQASKWDDVNSKFDCIDLPTAPPAPSPASYTFYKVVASSSAHPTSVSSYDKPVQTFCFNSSGVSIKCDSSTFTGTGLSGFEICQRAYPGKEVQCIMADDVSGAAGNTSAPKCNDRRDLANQTDDFVICMVKN